MRRVVWFLVGFAAVVVPSFWSAAHSAQVIWSSRDSVIVRGADGSVRSVPGVREMFANMADGSGGVNASAKQRVPVGAAAADVSLAKNVPKSAVAQAGRVAARVLGPVALATLAYDAYLYFDDETDQWQVPQAANPGSEFPPGEWWQNTTGIYGCTYGTGCDAVGAASSLVTYYKATFPAWNGSYEFGPMLNGTQRRVWMRGTMYGGPQDWDEVINLKTAGTCPNGFYLDSGDGMCYPEPTYIPATDADIETGISAGLDANPGAAPTILQHGLDAGYQPEASTPTVTGPSSVPGPSTTTTSSGPSGQTTTTSNTTHNLTYNTNVVTVTNTTTTTVTAPDNSVTTTTVTSSPPAGGEPVDEDKQSLCEETPNASACQELGDPEDEELEEQTEDVSFEQEGGAAGSCPASEPFWAGGTAQELSWQPTCDFASGIRPFVIGLAWLSAGIFVFAIASRKA